MTDFDLDKPIRQLCEDTLTEKDCMSMDARDLATAILDLMNDRDERLSRIIRWATKH